MLAVPHSIRGMLELNAVSLLELAHSVGELEGEEVFLGRVSVLRNLLVSILIDGVAFDLHGDVLND